MKRRRAQLDAEKACPTHVLMNASAVSSRGRAIVLGWNVPPEKNRLTVFWDNAFGFSLAV